MKTYNLIDKNSDIVIIASGENEEETRENVKDRIRFIDTFRIEAVNEEE